MKLTGAMRNALIEVYQTQAPHSARFPTLEALRRRGLVERQSFYCTKAYYADHNGEHRQLRWAGWHHDWYLTTAGRAALEHPHA